MKKIIAPILLLVISIISLAFSWSGRAATDYFNFTDIQTAGLTLKTGKSAVTSTTWMRRRDVDSLYAIDASYYSFAAKGINDWVVKQDIQAPSLGTLGGSGLIYSESGGNGWSACSSVNMTPSDQLANAWYTDGGSTPASGDHLYGNSSGTTNTTCTNNYWYAFNWDGIQRYVQLTNNGTTTTVVYAGSSCPSSGTNVGITSETGAISGTHSVDVYAYATQATNTDVVVSVHVVGDNGGTADVNVTITNGNTGGMVNISLGSGTLSSITNCYINSLSPTSYSGFNYNF